jgi:hypothetical protein
MESSSATCKDEAGCPDRLSMSLEKDSDNGVQAECRNIYTHKGLLKL